MVFYEIALSCIKNTINVTIGYLYTVSRPAPVTWKIILPLAILVVLIFAGTLGYYWIDGFSLFNAFYMTVITMATVGYGEVEPLSDNGRLFTVFLIITSFGTFAYAVTTVTKFIIDGELKIFFKEKKLSNSIDKLSGHVIICGFGRNGRQAAHILKKHHQRFVVIEQDSGLTQSLQHRHSDLILNGDATQDEWLNKAGIARASALITTLPQDADNVFIVLSARNLNAQLRIISRASDDGSDTKLKIAGADNVIMPDKVGGAHMASLVTKPDVIEFIDSITGQDAEHINLEEIVLEYIPATLEHKTLKDLEVRNKSGANIIGIKTISGQYLVNPSADTILQPHTKLFVLGSHEQVMRLKHILKH